MAEDKRNESRSIRFSFTEAAFLVSVAAIVLAIIALGGIRTYWMAALVAIILGTAVLLDTGGLISRVSGPAQPGKGSSGAVEIEWIAGGLPGPPAYFWASFRSLPFFRESCSL